MVRSDLDPIESLQVENGGSHLIVDVFPFFLEGGSKTAVFANLTELHTHAGGCGYGLRCI